MRVKRTHLLHVRTTIAGVDAVDRLQKTQGLTQRSDTIRAALKFAAVSMPRGGRKLTGSGCRSRDPTYVVGLVLLCWWCRDRV